MLLNTTTFLEGGMDTFSTLVDAYEGTMYATFTSRSAPHEGTTIMECDLTIPNAKQRHCSSKQEWMLLIKPYIETGAQP
jgi:hypothetical protein